MLILASISETLVNETAHFVREAGLPGVFALMALGSACIPVPSEVVMLFAGFAVADPGQSASQHHMTMLGIILAGLLGTMVGSWITYGIGRGGRLELLERHGSKLRWVPAHPPQVERAERWFERYGQPVVFFGRMVPLVRAFVSLPAGVARMPFWRFTVLSFLGSVPWVVALAFAGHALGGDWTSVRKYFQYVDYLVLLLIAGGIAYAIVRRRRGGSTGDPSESGAGSGAGPSAGAEPNPDADTSGTPSTDAAVDAG
jgi:membrane protein DedA with SNARE-associated domain